jgi:hypothetical protein
MNQTYEIKLNGKTIPATPYVGTIRNNLTIYNRGEIQNVNLKAIHAFYISKSPETQQDIINDFWKSIGTINWTLNMRTVLINIQLLKMRHFNVSSKLNAIKYMVEMHMNKLREVISHIKEFADLDNNEQNILLSHVVGLGEGTYNMITQMPEIIITLIQKKSYGNFMKYIGLDIQKTIVIDLDAMLGETQKNEVEALPEHDALSEHSEHSEHSDGGKYEYNSEYESEEHVET